MQRFGSVVLLLFPDLRTIPPAQEPLLFSPVLNFELSGHTRFQALAVLFMPLGRYFAFVGSLLLALLFLADGYMPKLPAEPTRVDIDRSIIRIHSRHEWPEAIVIDTSLPTIIPPPAPVADAPAGKSPHEALAMLPPAPPAVAMIEPKPVAPRRPARTARTAAGRVASYQATGSRDALPAGW
jgi:hypothetical protein